MTLRWTLLLVGLSLATQACVVESDGDLIVEDAIISWSIDGTIGTDLCDDFEIGSWVVELNGPEVAAGTYNCGVWDTGGDFIGSKALEIGVYDVTIDAYDFDGQLIDTQGVTYEITDLDGISPDEIPIDFPSSNFL